MKIRLGRNGRRVLLAAIAVGALAGGLIAPGHANAQVLGCRSDPVMELTNGTTIDLEAGINDSLSDVRSVTYVVHGPAGTGALLMINTDGLMGLVEHLSYVGDQPAGRYTSDTTVATGARNISFQPSMLLLGLLQVELGFASGTGVSGQTVHLQIGR